MASNAEEPSVRASLLRLYLRHIDAARPGDATPVREALGAEAVARIERASGHEWLPIAYEVAILRALRARHGDEAPRAVGRAVGRAAVDDAILRPLVRATLIMLGRRPDVLVHIALAGWRIATRNACRLAVSSRADGEVRLSMVDIPPVMRDRAMLLRMDGSLEALLGYGGVAAEVETDWEAGAAHATVRVRWSRG
ncbi:MAG TPA: hypothetical protein VIV57_26015 [Anaeromyxobacter sp.]